MHTFRRSVSCIWRRQFDESPDGTARSRTSSSSSICRTSGVASRPSGISSTTESRRQQKQFYTSTVFLHRLIKKQKESEMEFLMDCCAEQSERNFAFFFNARRTRTSVVTLPFMHNIRVPDLVLFYRKSHKSNVSSV